MPLNLYASLKNAQRLPTPSAVAMRILELVQREDTTLDELAQIIGSDPALSAKILKYVNSPMIGLGFQGTTLSDAIARIGMRGTQMLALSFSLVSRETQACSPSFNLDRYWSRSLARAVAARHLARDVAGWDVESAFISGLVCRIGQLAIATGLAKEYEPLLAASGENTTALEQHERETFGLDHLALGAQLLQDWRLPEDVWQVIRTMSAISAGTEQPAFGPGGGLSSADAIARFLTDDREHTADAYSTLTHALTHTLAIPAERIPVLLEAIAQDWSTHGQLLSVKTSRPPDLAAMQHAADEQLAMLRLASEMEVRSLRAENEQLSHVAQRDRLTGLLNRGAFDDALTKAITAAEHSTGALALLMIDVDHFKAINDVHGHPTGDAVLRHLARVLSTHAKTPAQVFRYGGEEFAVLIGETTLKDAAALAEALRAAIESSPHREESKSINLTASIGIAGARWPEQMLDAAALIHLADQRLYEAKRGGRNTCRSAPLTGDATPRRSGVWTRFGRMLAGSRS